MDSEMLIPDSSGDVTNDLHEAAGAGNNEERTKEDNYGSIGGENRSMESMERPNRDFSIETSEGPVGVDIGTSRIVEYHKDGLKFTKKSQLNAFFSVPSTKLTKGMLDRSGLQYKENDSRLLVVGDGAASFANIANGEVSRPMSSGIMNPEEENGPMIIEYIVKNMVEKPKDLGARLCFSLPGPRRGHSVDPIFHERIMKEFFVALGYMPKGVNEGFLLALSELQKDNVTGIGISCGAGLCNVCMAYISVPILSFSIPKAGDYIDRLAAMAVGEHTNRIRVIKEESLNLVDAPKNRIERALHIYYEDMILSLIQNLKGAMEESEHIPKIDKPIPIVLGGGTILPDGFRDKFDNILREAHFPIAISEVRIAEEPLTAIAKGAYLAACLEKGEEEEE